MIGSKGKLEDMKARVQMLEDAFYFKDTAFIEMAAHLNIKITTFDYTEQDKKEKRINKFLDKVALCLKWKK